MEPESKTDIEYIFEQKTDDILSDEERFSKEGEKIRTGVETEYFVLNKDLSIIESEDKRNKLLENLVNAKKELGADSVEIATEPVYLDSIGDLKSSIGSKEEELKLEADKNDLRILRSGTNAFRKLDNLELSDKEFFVQINDYYNDEDRSQLIGDKNKVDVGDSKSVSLISAIHTNIEASDFDDAIQKANYVYMISPYISALSGNARFLEGRDTGLSDLRMILWSKSHNTENRQIGALEKYYSDMDDYMERVGSWPFILGRDDKVISDSISRFWKDSRIKFIEDDIVVESRIASTQPSIVEDVAVHAFCIGRVLYAQRNNEKLLEIEKVNDNREEALRKGLDSMLYSTEGIRKKASDLLLDEIKKAREGLKTHNIRDQGYLDILEERVKKGKTPSDKIAEKVNSSKTDNGDKELFDALKNSQVEVG